MNSELKRIDASWDELVALVNQVQDAGGLTQIGKDRWSVKDHLAHVAAWEHSLVALLEGRDRLEAMGVRGVEDEIDAINEAVRKRHEGDTTEEALEYFRASHAQMVAALQKVGDDDLQKPYSHFQPSDPDEMRPTIGWVAGNTYEHYPEHIAWINQLLSESSAKR